MKDRRDTNCRECNKKLKKDDMISCWHSGCQTMGARCGDCAELHESIHLRCKD